MMANEWTHMTFSRDLFDWEVDLLGPLLEILISSIFLDIRIWILE